MVRRLHLPAGIALGLLLLLLAMPLLACGLVAVQSIYTEEILGDKREIKAQKTACP